MLTDDEFIDLYKNGYKRACSIFVRTGLEPDLCDDVAQDMYERMWRYRHWKTDNYTPITFWFLNLKFCLLKVVPKYKAGEFMAVNSEAVQYVVDHYPDPVDMTEQVDIDSLLNQLPSELAIALRVKLFDGDLSDQAEVSALYGNSTVVRNADAQRKKIKRLIDSPEVQSILREYFGRYIICVGIRLRSRRAS